MSADRNNALLTILAPVLLLAGPAPGTQAQAQAPQPLVLNAEALVAAETEIRLPAEGPHAVRALVPRGSEWTWTPAENDDNAYALARVAPPPAPDAPLVVLDLGNARPAPDRTLRVRRPAPDAPLPVFLAFLPENADPAALDLAAFAAATRGADRAGPVDDPRRTVVRTNQTGADFQPPDDPDAWRARAEELRLQLRVTLGILPELPRTPLRARVGEPLARDGYTIQKVVLETLPDFYLCGNLYRPANPPRDARLPAILSPHGHYREGRYHPDVQARCAHWARLGAVVFMYDMVGYADSAPFGHAFANDRLVRRGLSLATLQTWNSIRALDWISSLPDVDSARVACTGESGGGTQTFLLAAIDRRLAATVPVVMVSEGFQGGCACENSPGLRHAADNVEIAALAAPVPQKFVAATGDWTANTLRSVLPPVRKVYSLVGSPDDVRADIFEADHNYNQTSRESVYPFLAPILLGPAVDPALYKEPGDFRPETAEVLAAIPPGAEPPGRVASPRALQQSLELVLDRQIDKLAPAAGLAAWSASRDLLDSVRRVRVGVRPQPVPPSRFRAEPAPRPPFLRDGIRIAHLEIERDSDPRTRIQNQPRRVPVVLLLPERNTDNPPDRLVVLASGRGKAALFQPDGSPSPLVRELVALNLAVVGFDPLFAGEAFDTEKPAEAPPDTPHYLTYNPANPVHRARDLALVLSWAKRGNHPAQPARSVSLVALDSMAPLALLAAPDLHDAARIHVDLDRFDYEDPAADVHRHLDLPGVLQFGALKAAAALAAPKPLWIARPAPVFQRQAPDWVRKAYELAGVPRLLQSTDEAPEPAQLARWLDDGTSPRTPDAPEPRARNR